jgi:hypothetical protein
MRNSLFIVAAAFACTAVYAAAPGSTSKSPSPTGAKASPTKGATTAKPSSARSKVPTLSPDVKKGVIAWEKENWVEAVRLWRKAAEAGDADAQFNLGQAYKLGRGVEFSLDLAREWYLKAARSGHHPAADNYGLTLYQEGRKADALPWVMMAAGRGERRNQLVLGTLLFNGDNVEKDWPTAYALMIKAAQQGMEQAVMYRAKMDKLMTEADRKRGADIAALTGKSWAEAVSIKPEAILKPGAKPAKAPTALASSSGSNTATRKLASAKGATGTPLRPGTATAITKPNAASGAIAGGGRRWRIQLGAFETKAGANKLWSNIRSVFDGGHPLFVEYGGMTRLQVAGFQDRAEAALACKTLINVHRQPCIMLAV